MQGQVTHVLMYIVSRWLCDEPCWSWQAQQSQSNEPGGLCTNGQLVLIADTNNHALPDADFSTGMVRTLKPMGLDS